MARITQPTEKVSVAFRMDPEKRDMLEELCDVNQRSQRELVELMVEKYYKAWLDNPNLRITP